MGKVIKCTIAIKPEDLFIVEAGPISIMMGQNLQTSSKKNTKSLKRNQQNYNKIVDKK
jgi:hypothetical protein